MLWCIVTAQASRIPHQVLLLKSSHPILYSTVEHISMQDQNSWHQVFLFKSSHPILSCSTYMYYVGPKLLAPSLSFQINPSYTVLQCIICRTKTPGTKSFFSNHPILYCSICRTKTPGSAFYQLQKFRLAPQCRTGSVQCACHGETDVQAHGLHPACQGGVIQNFL